MNQYLDILKLSLFSLTVPTSRKWPTLVWATPCSRYSDFRKRDVPVYCTFVKQRNISLSRKFKMRHFVRFLFSIISFSATNFSAKSKNKKIDKITQISRLHVDFRNSRNLNHFELFSRVTSLVGNQNFWWSKSTLKE